ncbi:rhomboid family intramembrane serine protease [Desulfovibrio piger]|uniref:rhomboid family intramembrane serine protease n=1 Tax=Desulfovibrio piger TaxID=901 RepID=UPI00195E9D57|nr:rhomboid family intramembrane serine protease [Desulfovibrio piger]MBM6893685.1 rhomboid family intramembrane serine protease [Desulfovibrio piger]MDM8328710.1 rhomboid family intramembrane serine protease [Desulfovibrio piger]
MKPRLLRLPAPFAGYWHAQRRPRPLPFHWRSLTGPEGITSYSRRQEMILVLSACGLPHQLWRFRQKEYIYVPALLEGLARQELQHFHAEKQRPPAPRGLPPALHARCWLTALPLLLLVFWHGLRSGWWPLPDGLPLPMSWEQAGALDNVRLRIYGEWQRLFTALTLHADAAHLTGNVLLGGIMLPLLARLTGPGRALLLTVLGGGLGNLLTVALRREFVLSLGFSTAVFAAIGALAGYMVLHHESKRYLPLAAGVGILAMWGMGEGNVDYLAHICGLVAGMALGFWEALRTRRRWPGLPQWLSALLALLLPVLAWIQAFQQG